MKISLDEMQRRTATIKTKIEDRLKDIGDMIRTHEQMLADQNTTKRSSFPNTVSSSSSSSSTSNRASAIQIDMKEQEEAMQATNRVRDNKVAMATLTARLLELQQDETELHNAINSISLSLPRLEQEKAIAVSGRNFKEAKRIANALKESSAEKEAKAEQLKNITNQLEETKSQLTHAKDEETTLLKQLKEVQQTIGMDI